MASLFDEPNKKAISHLRYHKTIALAVSGDVKLTRLETAIIDTPEFQRLRTIQQLGSCSWVYPTAVHTRFDHSLGVLKMTDRMIAAINEGIEQVERKPDLSPDLSPTRHAVTNQQRVLARLCALLHDVTHVPYGHTLEDELRIFGSHDNIGANVPSDGAQRFEILVGENSRIGNLIRENLGKPMYDRLMNIIYHGREESLPVDDEEGKSQDEFIYHLVSDTICGDLLDYIERDSFFCNLGIAVPKRFLDYLFITDVSLPEFKGKSLRRVVVRLWKPRDGTPRYDVMTDVASVLDARYKLTERVYFHHTKITTAAMIGRAAQEAKLVGLLNSVQMLQFGDATFLDYLVNLEKRVTATQLKQHGKKIKIIQRLAKSLVERALYERIKSYPKEEFWTSPTENCYYNLIEWFASADRRREIENTLAQAGGGNEGDVLIYVASPSMNRKIARAVVDYGGERTLLKDVPEPTLKARIENIEHSHFRLWKVDILVSPEIDRKKHDLIRWAFESQFLPSDRKESAFALWLHHIAANDDTLVGPHAEIDEACRLAAKDLARRPGVFSGHDMNVVELLRQKLRETLNHSTE